MTVCWFIHRMLNTNYTEIFRYTTCYRRKRRQIGNLSSEEKNNKSSKLYDCRIHWTSEVWTPMFRNAHQCSHKCSPMLISPSVDQCFAHFYVRLTKICAHLPWFCCIGNAWRNNSLKNSKCNHNHYNTPIDIKISLL